MKKDTSDFQIVVQDNLKQNMANANLAKLPSSASYRTVASYRSDVEIADQKVETVRQNILPQYQAMADDATIRRFIRATAGKLNESAKRLNATCAWRLSTHPEQVVCNACVKNNRSHYMHVVGHDSEGRPIIYSCLALAVNKVYEDNRDHMVQTFETAIKCMPPGVEQWIWVCDFHGFGMADAMNVKLAKAFLEISATHYPERLGVFMIVDAPGLFNLLWKAISPFVDPKTYKKIRFLPYDVTVKQGSKLLDEFSKTVDTETQAWLLREIAENRDKAKIKEKRYDIPSIHKAASSGMLSNGSSGENSGKDKLSQVVHDVRGTSELLELYATTPSVLEPQGLAKA